MSAIVSGRVLVLVLLNVCLVSCFCTRVWFFVSAIVSVRASVMRVLYLFLVACVCNSFVFLVSVRVFCFLQLARGPSFCDRRLCLVYVSVRVSVSCFLGCDACFVIRISARVSCLFFM